MHLDTECMTDTVLFIISVLTFLQKISEEASVEYYDVASNSVPGGR